MLKMILNWTNHVSQVDFILNGCNHTDCVRNTTVMSLGDKCSCAVCKTVVNSEQTTWLYVS